jgi:hypothetical protein
MRRTGVRPWRLGASSSRCVHEYIHGHKARLGIMDYRLLTGLGPWGQFIRPWSGREERRKTSHAVTGFGGTPWSAEVSSGDWWWAVAAMQCLLCRAGVRRLCLGEGNGRLEVDCGGRRQMGCGGLLGCLLPWAAHEL